MMPGLNDPRFELCLDEFFDDFRAQKALHFRLLLNRGQGRIIKGTARYIVKAYDRAILWNFPASFSQCANCSAGSKIVEGDQGGKSGIALDQFLGYAVRLRIG